MSTTTKRKSKLPQMGRPKGSTNTYGVNLSAIIRDTINENQRFLHQREIVKVLTKKVGKKNIADEMEFARKTSVLIHSLKTRNQITQYSISDSTRERYYGKPEWIKSGKVKPQFAPKD